MKGRVETLPCSDPTKQSHEIPARKFNIDHSTLISFPWLKDRADGYNPFIHYRGGTKQAMAPVPDAHCMYQNYFNLVAEIWNCGRGLSEKLPEYFYGYTLGNF